MKNNTKSYGKKALLGLPQGADPAKFSVAIVLLRVMATCLITNTHYNHVYPSERFAIGGLLGDVIFFAVSGYCFAGGIKENFSRWYTKRWIRVYPSVLLMSVCFALLGFWEMPGMDLTELCAYFVLPTRFLFFGAIMLCYIPMYFAMRANHDKALHRATAIWFVAYVLFLLGVDKTAYVMNAVSHPAVLFLYFGAILAGAWVKRTQSAKQAPLSVLVKWGLLVLFAAVYFLSTVIIRANSRYYAIQFVVPVSLLAMVYSLVSAVVSMEHILKKIPQPVLRALGFVANLTLEIYVVQLILIDAMEDILFPVNWVMITLSILCAAAVLKLLTFGITEKLKRRLLETPANV